MLSADAFCEGTDLLSECSDLCLDGGSRRVRRRGRCVRVGSADGGHATTASDVHDAVGHGGELLQRQVCVAGDDWFDLQRQRRHPNRHEDLIREVVPGLSPQMPEMLRRSAVAHRLVGEDPLDPCRL